MAKDLICETESLHLAARRIRSESIQAKISLAFTLCKLAETELRIGNSAYAQVSIQIVREKTEFLHLHVNLPHHVLPETVPHFRDQLVKLESFIARIEAQLHG